MLTEKPKRGHCWHSYYERGLLFTKEREVCCTCGETRKAQPFPIGNYLSHGPYKPDPDLDVCDKC